MKIFFLLNPSKSKSLWDLREAAGKAARTFGWAASFGQVDRQRPAASDPLVLRAVADGTTRLVVVGGDGTLHATINALAKEGKLSRVSLGLVPAGTCNDFARTIGLNPRRMDEAMRIACGGKGVSTDLGRMDDRLFINNAGFGRPRSVVQPGRRAKPLKTLRSFQPVPVTVRWEKGALEGQFYMALACNAPFFSKGLFFSKSPKVDDGLLDVYLVPRVSKWKLVQRLLLGKLGRPVAFRQVISLKVPKLEVEAQADLWPQADGEPPAAKPVRRLTFALADQKAMIVLPAGTSKNTFWESSPKS
jgi:diacylglycerol kinase (ATP)